MFILFAGCVLAELIKGEALWPGKSDVDQLFLIRCTVGDFIPRHMLAFKNNDFFQGVILPVPQQFTPLETKLPSTDTVTIDFLKVTSNFSLIFLLFIMQIFVYNNVRSKKFMKSR